MIELKSIFDGFKTLVTDAYTYSVEHVDGAAGRHVLIVPNGHRIEDLTDKIAERDAKLYELEEKRGAGPRRINGVETAQTLAGFCDLVNRHKGSTTAISARGGAQPQLVATIDYHGASDGKGGPDPRWREHKVTYGFPFTEQFKAWGRAGNWMSKRDFLDFCDRRALELAPPDDVQAGPVTDAIFQKVLIAKGWTKAQKLGASLDAVFGGAAELLMAARAVKVVTEERLEENIDELGMVSVSYSKKDTLEKWEARRYYLVQVRVFEGDGEERVVPARLDLRTDGGRLELRFVLLALDLIVENAFDAACKEVAERTAIAPIRAVF